MKRTPLQRKTPMKRSQLRRVTPLRPRSKTNKRPPAESGYLRWIRTLPCAVCDGAHGPSEAAHTNVFGPSGCARKTPNRSVIPLCPHCHRIGLDAYHAITPEWRWSDYHGIELPALVARLNRCYDLIRESGRRPRITLECAA